MKQPLVSIVMGSDSDFPIMEESTKILDGLGIDYEITISSAHRSPTRTMKYIKAAVEKGIEVIIAGAGAAAHLAGVISAETAIPVIGVPIDSSSLNGLDALLSTVQMPGGVPVATMAIGKTGAKNAAVLAAQILGLKYPNIKCELNKYKKSLALQVEEKAKILDARLGQKRSL